MFPAQEKTGNTPSNLPGLPKFEQVNATVIQPSRGWVSLGLRDVWEYRELLVFLVWRELQGIYRQTALGISWIFLRPIINMVILSLVFGRLIKGYRMVCLIPCFR